LGIGAGSLEVIGGTFVVRMLEEDGPGGLGNSLVVRLIREASLVVTWDSLVVTTREDNSLAKVTEEIEQDLEEDCKVRGGIVEEEDKVDWLLS